MPCTVKLGIAPFPSLLSGFYCSSSCLERMPHEGRECFRGRTFLEQHSYGCPSLGSQSTPQIIWLVLHLCWSNLDNWSTLPERIQDRLFFFILWWGQKPPWSPAWEGDDVFSPFTVTRPRTTSQVSFLKENAEGEVPGLGNPLDLLFWCQIPQLFPIYWNWLQFSNTQ